MNLSGLELRMHSQQIQERQISIQGSSVNSSNAVSMNELQRRSDLLLLFMASMVPVLGLLLEVVHSGRSVAVSFWPAAQLPDLCFSRRFFNWECPGCGLTRSVVHLMHGRWHASWSSHRLGWLVFSFIVMQIPYRIWRLWGHRIQRVNPRESRG